MPFFKPIKNKEAKLETLESQVKKLTALKDFTTEEAQELKQACWKLAVKMGDMEYVHELRKVLSKAEGEQLVKDVFAAGVENEGNKMLDKYLGANEITRQSANYKTLLGHCLRIARERDDKNLKKQLLKPGKEVDEPLTRVEFLQTRVKLNF